jgi:hypothetical protein
MGFCRFVWNNEIKNKGWNDEKCEKFGDFGGGVDDGFGGVLQGFGCDCAQGANKWDHLVYGFNVGDWWNCEFRRWIRGDQQGYLLEFHQ